MHVNAHVSLKNGDIPSSVARIEKHGNNFYIFHVKKYPRSTENYDFGHDPWSEPDLIFQPYDNHVGSHVCSKNGDIPSSVAHIENHGMCSLFHVKDFVS